MLFSLKAYGYSDLWQYMYDAFDKRKGIEKIRPNQNVQHYKS